MPKKGDFTAGMTDEQFSEIEENRRIAMNPPQFRPGMDHNVNYVDDPGDTGFGDPGFGAGGAGFGMGGSSVFGAGSQFPSPFDSGGAGAFGGPPAFGGTDAFGAPGGAVSPVDNSAFGEVPGFMNGADAGFSRVYNPANPLAVNQQGQPQKVVKSEEDQIFDFLAGVIKAVWSWFKGYLFGLKNLSDVGWMRTGRALIFLSLAFFACGVALHFSIKAQGVTDATFSLKQVIIASVIGEIIGIPLFLVKFKKVGQLGSLTDPDSYEQPEPVMEAPDIEIELGPRVAAEAPVVEPESPIQSVSPPSFGFGGGFANWGASRDLDDPDEPSETSRFTNNGFDTSTQEEKTGDASEILSGVTQQDNRYRSRSFLFEKAMSFLSYSKSNYMDSVTLRENSKEFLAYCGYVDQAANMVAPAKGEHPQVLEIKDKLYYTTITLSRPNWLSPAKLNSLVDEVLSQRRYNVDTDTVDSSITASGQVVGDRAVIKINKGNTTTVSVKDVFMAEKDWVLNVSTDLPVVFGMQASGDPILRDFSKIHSLLISGEPRSGKSWALKSLLGQLLMLHGPDEVQFYLCDPKGMNSDFYTIRTPHVREFTSTVDGVMRIFQFCCGQEADRRAQIISGAGCMNIDDLHRLHPEITLPRLYVVIDEIMTFSATMDSETRSTFYKMMGAFTSRLPGFGMHLIIVPHLAKNQVVDKTVIDLIPNKICVRGTPENIESSLGVSQREFPYACTNPGDMALHLSGDASRATFARSVVLATSNETYTAFFDFCMNMWVRLMPDYVQGSRLESDILTGALPVSSCDVIRSDPQFAELVAKAGSCSVYNTASMGQGVDSGSSDGAGRASRPARPRSTSGGSPAVPGGNAGAPRRPRKF